MAKEPHEKIDIDEVRPLEVAVERPVGSVPATDAKPAWGPAFKRAAAKFSLDGCTDVAAMLTYYSVLALFPGLAAVVSLIGVFNVDPNVIIETVAEITGKSASDPTFNDARSIITRFSEGGGAGVALLIGLLGALWSASGYVGGFSRALNRIYDVGEGRAIWKLRPWLLAVTAVLVLLIVSVLLALALSGGVAEAIGSRIGLGDTAVTVWNIAKWPVVAAIVMLIISLLYWATPNVKKPRSMVLSWGAMVAFFVWVVGSGAFATYLTLTKGASYQKTYGAFAAAVMFLLWLWITNLALLFGAELDAELERTRQLRTGLPAEQMILLPARDEKGLGKIAEKHDKFIDQAQTLRRQSDVDPEAVGAPYTPLQTSEVSDERTAAAGARYQSADPTATRAHVDDDGIARHTVGGDASEADDDPDNDPDYSERSPRA